MTETPQVVSNQIKVLLRELDELASGRWGQRESKVGGRSLQAIAGRIVLSAKHLESLVRENSFRP